MKKTLKNAIIIMLAAGLCLSIVGIATADEPTYGDITLEPAEPNRESDVTYSVEVTGVNITEVWINVMECTDPDSPTYFCHPEYNVSMTKGEGNTWEVTKALEFDDSAEGHCWLVIKSNGTWYDFKSDIPNYTNFTILPGADGDGNGGGGTDDTGGTPGFELILVIISIVVALSIYKRKRK